MKRRLNEKELELMQRVQKITLTDYEIDDRNFIDIDSLFSAIQDLVCEVDNKEEQIEDLKIPNDYDPEIEIPPIHGQEISY